MSDEGLRSGERVIVLTSDDLVALSRHERAAERAGVASPAVQSVRHELLERFAHALKRRHFHLLVMSISGMQEIIYEMTIRDPRRPIEVVMSDEIRGMVENMPGLTMPPLFEELTPKQRAREKTRENVRRRPPRSIR